MSAFFSIIVVSLNAEKFIGQTINSILNQSYKNYEVIIKDGESKDNTLSFIPKNDNRFRTYVIPDHSIYEAMNQAISKSTGKYTIFMNCGDVFADDDVLDDVRKNIGDTEYTFFYGDYKRDNILHKQPNILSDFYMYRTPLCHQTIFFNGKYLRNQYRYDTKYKILADYDLELRLMKKGKIGHVSRTICIYQGGGVSELKEGIKLKKNERKQILKEAYRIEERFIYGLKYHATLPSVRTFVMYSEKTPRWMKNLYQFCVNKINR